MAYLSACACARLHPNTPFANSSPTCFFTPPLPFHATMRISDEGGAIASSYSKGHATTAQHRKGGQTTTKRFSRNRAGTGRPRENCAKTNQPSEDRAGTTQHSEGREGMNRRSKSRKGTEGTSMTTRAPGEDRTASMTTRGRGMNRTEPRRGQHDPARAVRGRDNKSLQGQLPYDIGPLRAHDHETMQGGREYDDERTGRGPHGAKTTDGGLREDEGPARITQRQDDANMANDTAGGTA
ncbi:hypothetical protein BDW22DRAFT_1345768 [Trametopsis cervina]|nr:hypothetical protein BDW22DRAFT_1345768 [Trametopsis cervina]